MRKIIFPVLLAGSILLSILTIKLPPNKTGELSSRNINSSKTSRTFNTSETKDKVKLLFAGDMMFDRLIRSAAQENENDFIFQSIHSTLADYDFVIANLEGPITNKNSVSIGSDKGSKENYIFTFDLSFSETLFKNNIKIVNLGNNHTLNFGEDGLWQTILNLENTSVKYFGHTGSTVSNQTFLISEIKGIKIAFVNYNQFIDNAKSLTLNDIKLANDKSDITILYAHWGIEYEPKANFAIQKLAKEFIDEGVDLIIGSHPHVVQQNEVYNKKIIYYSLGNFIFDQYFSEETKNGLLIKVVIDPKTLELTTVEIPIYTETNGQTRLQNIPTKN